ncbi:MAG: glutathione S-transferase N-terminal domain-containing protein [Alphaproteobacteria bacterium]
MARTLYELTGRNDNRFSPYCWRARFALAHKGLNADRIAIGFTEKERIAFSGQPLVPVLVDGDTTVSDSWKIACYLEERYPDAPSLFGGAVGQSEALFINFWCDRTVLPSLAPAIILDIFQRVRPEDQPYFRESREKRYSKPLEAICPDPEAQLSIFRKALDPARGVISVQPYLSGEAPGYADYILAGLLQWARLVSPQDVLAAGDPLVAWRDSIFDLFDGMGRKASAAAA